MNKQEATNLIKTSDEINPLQFMEFWGDKEFAVAAVSKNNEYYQYISDDLKEDLEVFIEAIKNGNLDKSKIISQSSSYIKNNFYKEDNPIKRAEFLIKKSTVDSMRKRYNLTTTFDIYEVNILDLKKLHKLNIKEIHYDNSHYIEKKKYALGEVPMIWLGLWQEFENIITRTEPHSARFIEGIREIKPGVFFLTTKH